MSVTPITPVNVQALIDELQAETQLKLNALMDDFSVDYRLIVGMLEDLKYPYLIDWREEE